MLYAIGIASATRQVTANWELARTVRKIFLDLQACAVIEMQWTRGHSTDPGNTHVDALAAKARGFLSTTAFRPGPAGLATAYNRPTIDVVGEADVLHSSVDAA